MKSWLHDNMIEIYAAHNEGNSIVAQRFIRTLKKNFFKHITTIAKNVCFAKRDEIVDKHSKTYHKTKKKNENC